MVTGSHGLCGHHAQSLVTRGIKQRVDLVELSSMAEFKSVPLALLKKKYNSARMCCANQV